MSRAAIYSLLVGDTTLSAYGITAATIHASGKLTNPGKTGPFVVLRFETVQNRWGVRGERGKQGLTVWVHDHTGDYSRIDTILGRIKTLLSEAAHVVGVDGWVLTQADWRGESPDLFDDGYSTITRNSVWEIVTRQEIPA